jgi:glutathione S-transferase
MSPLPQHTHTHTHTHTYTLQLYAPALQAARPAVDDWVEWAFRQLKPAVAAAPGSEDAAGLIHLVTVLEQAVGGNGGQGLVAGGEGLSLADLVVAPVAKRALGFFGEHEYVRAHAYLDRFCD